MPLSLSDAEFSAVQAARRAYPFTPARRLPASFSRGAGEASRRRSRARAPPGCGLAEAIRRGSAQRNWAAPSSVAPGERLRRPNRNTTATPTIYRLSSVLAFSHGQRRDITSPHESSMGVAGMQLLPVFRPPCCSKRPDPGQGGLKERVVMAKEKKTKTEMAGLIAVKIGVGLTFVKVIADPALGWHPARRRSANAGGRLAGAR
jgi:hypothetical protein